MSVVTTNASFVKAVGTVAHIHIGIYARILALFLMVPESRPVPRNARLWVDMIRWVKENAPGGRLSFFTYMELMVWLVSFLFLNVARLPYAFFVLFGWGFWTRDGPLDKQGRAVGAPHFHLSTSKRECCTCPLPISTVRSRSPSISLAHVRTRTVLPRYRQRSAVGGPVPPKLDSSLE